MNKQGKYFSIIFLIIILYLSFLLIKPFIGPLISAIIISYIIYPFFERINKKVKNKNLSISLMLMLVIFLIMVPLTLIIYSLIDDMGGVLEFLRHFNINSIPFITPEMVPIIQEYFVGISEKLTSYLLGILSKFVTGIPDKLINILVFLVATSLFLKNGPDIIKKFKITIPIEKAQKGALIEEFGSVTKAMIYAILSSVIFNGVAGGIIFYLFNIPNSLMWGFLMSLLSFIPLVGSFPVWIGGILYLVLSGQYLFGVLLLAIQILVANLDNLIMMKVTGKKSNINSFLMLMGIISGLRVFSLIGLILGPLILSILITLIRFYTKNYKEKFNF